MNDADSIPTRQTLLAKLKDLDDQQSWREFFDIYWRLIHAAARRAGLTETEAQEVVQETMIAAANKMPNFEYRPGKDSLKGWLLSVTRWKVADQFRRRNIAGAAASAPPSSLGEKPSFPSDDTALAPPVERLADFGGHSFDALWDAEWRQNLMRAALDRVKHQVNPSHYEMYHLHVVQGLSAKETAQALTVSRAVVHLAKHRVGRRLKAELKRLESHCI